MHAASPTAPPSTPAATSTDPAAELPADHFFNDSARIQEEIFFGQASFGADEIDGEEVMRAVNDTNDELIIYPGQTSNTVSRLRIIDGNARAEIEGSQVTVTGFLLVLTFFPEGTIDNWMLETIQRGIDSPQGVADSETFGPLKLTIEAFTAQHEDEIVIDVERAAGA